MYLLEGCNGLTTSSAGASNGVELLTLFIGPLHASTN